MIWMRDSIITNDNVQLSTEGYAAQDTFVALVESRRFLRECLARSMQSAFSVPVVTFSSLSELCRQPCGGSAALVILSLMGTSGGAWESALKDLSEDSARSPIVTLASKNDVELAQAAIRHGAKGYIPLTMGFEVAVAAIRIVLAGGTFVPPDHFLATDARGLPPKKTLQLDNILTSRELVVVSAVKEGKSNRTIAYDLNVSESTVKVHLRNIMGKLGAKNRTEVAMMTQSEVHCKFVDLQAIR